MKGRIYRSIMLLTILASFIFSRDHMFTKKGDHMSEAISRIKFETMSEEEQHEQHFLNQIKHTQFESDNHCIGGRQNNLPKHPTGEQISEYLKRFREGPCSPTIFIPGIAGSKLIAKIDCYIIKKSSPALFEACGWKTCAEGENSPDSEYLAWIPHLVSRNSFLLSSESSRTCFMGLIGLKPVKTESNGEITLEFVNTTPGVEIFPYGMSDQTSQQSTSKCAFDGITNLLSIELDINLIVDRIKVDPQSYFNNLRLYFQDKGYISGVTMQALPYDWRRGYQDHLLYKGGQLLSTIKSLYALTGKKVMLVAHSMGNLNVQFNLWKMSQQDKDQFIARYVALAGPVLGAPESTMGPLGMNNFLEILNTPYISLGVTAGMFRSVIAKYPSTFQLCVKRFFRENLAEPWMKMLLQRAKEETEGTELTDKQNIINRIFPDTKETCNRGFTGRKSDKCVGYFYDLFDLGEITDNNGKIHQINPDTSANIFGSFSYDDMSPLIYKYSEDKLFDKQENLGVQTNIVFSSHFPTRYKMFYKEVPLNKTLVNEYFKLNEIESNFDEVDKDGHPIKGDVLYKPGDKSVLTSSAISPGIKWAYEFDQKKPNTHPVTFNEVCGEYNVRTTPFDAGSEEKPTITASTFGGLRCGCKSSVYWNEGAAETADATDGGLCDHQNLPGDPGVVQFTFNAALDRQKAVNLQLPEADTLEKIYYACRIAEQRFDFNQIIAKGEVKGEELAQ